MADILVEYSETGGAVNTNRTLEKAKARGNELGINTFVIATTTGTVGLRAAEYLQGSNVIIVRHGTQPLTTTLACRITLSRYR